MIFTTEGMQHLRARDPGLGSLAVEGVVAEKPLSAAMPRKVLAVLLLNHNQPVTIGSLVDELWASDPPRLAKKTVQTYVYQLRGYLDPPASAESRVESNPGRYTVRLAPGELDWADAQDRPTSSGAARS